MKYKIGDKVKLVGDSGWNSQIRQDIGLTGTVVRLCGQHDKDVYLKMSGGASQSTWNIIGGRGIKKAGEEQLLFSFMYEDNNE